MLVNVLSTPSKHTPTQRQIPNASKRGLSTNAKIGLAAAVTSAGALGLAYLTMQPTQAPSLGNSFEPSTDYVTPIIISGLTGIFTTITCLITGACQTAKEKEPAKNNKEKLASSSGSNASKPLQFTTTQSSTIASSSTNDLDKDDKETLESADKAPEPPIHEKLNRLANKHPHSLTNIELNTTAFCSTKDFLIRKACDRDADESVLEDQEKKLDLMKLPTDVIKVILSKLEAEDLEELMEVSTVFYQYAKDETHWKDLCEKYYNNNSNPGELKYKEFYWEIIKESNNTNTNLRVMGKGDKPPICKTIYLPFDEINERTIKRIIRKRKFPGESEDNMIIMFNGEEVTQKNMPLIRSQRDQTTVLHIDFKEDPAELQNEPVETLGNNETLSENENEMRDNVDTNDQDCQLRLKD